jgi:hypothetical protein
MSFDTLGDLNWLAVIVAAIVWYAVGAVWYMPAVFGKPWMRSIGWDPDASPPAMTPVTYAIPLLAMVVGTAGIGMLAVATATDTFGEGLVLGLVLGVAISTVLFVVTAVFDPLRPEPVTWVWTTGGYHLVGILVASVILAVW